MTKQIIKAPGPLVASAKVFGMLDRNSQDLHIWSCQVQGYLGVIRYTLLKMDCISKTASRKQNGVKFRTLGY